MFCKWSLSNWIERALGIEKHSLCRGHQGRVLFHFHIIVCLSTSRPSGPQLVEKTQLQSLSAMSCLLSWRKMSNFWIVCLDRYPFRMHTLSQILLHGQGGRHGPPISHTYRFCMLWVSFRFYLDLIWVTVRWGRRVLFLPMARLETVALLIDSSRQVLLCCGRLPWSLLDVEWSPWLLLIWCQPKIPVASAKCPWRTQFNCPCWELLNQNPQPSEDKTPVDQ